MSGGATTANHMPAALVIDGSGFGLVVTPFLVPPTRTISMATIPRLLLALSGEMADGSSKFKALDYSHDSSPDDHEIQLDRLGRVLAPAILPAPPSPSSTAVMLECDSNNNSGIDEDMIIEPECAFVTEEMCVPFEDMTTIEFPAELWENNANIISTVDYNDHVESSVELIYCHDPEVDITLIEQDNISQLTNQLSTSTHSTTCTGDITWSSLSDATSNEEMRDEMFVNDCCTVVSEGKEDDKETSNHSNIREEECEYGCKTESEDIMRCHTNGDREEMEGEVMEIDGETTGKEVMKEVVMAFEQETTEKEMIVETQQETTEKEVAMSVKQETTEKEVAMSVEQETTEKEKTTEKEVTMSVEQKTTEKEVAMSVEQETTEKEVTMAIEQETTEKEVIMAIEQETTEKEVTMPVEQKTTEKEVTMSVEQEATEKEVTMSVEQEATEKEVTMSVEQETTEKEVTISVEQETTMKEVRMEEITVEDCSTGKLTCNREDKSVENEIFPQENIITEQEDKEGLCEDEDSSAGDGQLEIAEYPFINRISDSEVERDTTPYFVDNENVSDHSVIMIDGEEYVIEEELNTSNLQENQKFDKDTVTSRVSDKYMRELIERETKGEITSSTIEKHVIFTTMDTSACSSIEVNTCKDTCSLNMERDTVASDPVIEKEDQYVNIQCMGEREIMNVQEQSSDHEIMSQDTATTEGDSINENTICSNEFNRDVWADIGNEEECETISKDQQQSPELKVPLDVSQTCFSPTIFLKSPVIHLVRTSSLKNLHYHNYTVCHSPSTSSSSLPSTPLPSTPLPSSSLPFVPPSLTLSASSSETSNKKNRTERKSNNIKSMVTRSEKNHYLQTSQAQTLLDQSQSLIPPCFLAKTHSDKPNSHSTVATSLSPRLSVKKIPTSSLISSPQQNSLSSSTPVCTVGSPSLHTSTYTPSTLRLSTHTPPSLMTHDMPSLHSPPYLRMSQYSPAINVQKCNLVTHFNKLTPIRPIKNPPTSYRPRENTPTSSHRPRKNTPTSSDGFYKPRETMPTSSDGTRKKPSSVSRRSRDHLQATSSLSRSYSMNGLYLLSSSSNIVQLGGTCTTTPGTAGTSKGSTTTTASTTVNNSPINSKRGNKRTSANRSFDEKGGGEGGGNRRSKKSKRDSSDGMISDWSCVLCNHGNNFGDLGYLFGPYTVASKPQEVWVHYKCVIWAPGVFLVGDELVGLSEAIAEAMVCSKCNNHGATITCHYHSCKLPFHYPCAFEEGCKFNTSQYTVTCPSHSII